MGWLDANEVYVMETIARDRVEELRALADPMLAGADSAGEAPGDAPEAGHVRPPCDSIEIGGGRRRARRLGAPGLAC
jgi:hypothetical protein